MKTAIFYDTETTGFPIWKKPSGSDDQPHIVQLAALLVDMDTRETVETMDVIVKPDGWEIPAEISDIHGITTEHALEVGIPEKEVVQQFIGLWNDRHRVAHNRTFDKRIIRIALKRYFDNELQDRWAEKDNHDCTMLMAKHGYKNLEAAYKHYTGIDLVGAHNAMVDAMACRDLYFSIQNHEDEMPF